MSESPGDVKPGCELRVLQADGSTTTLHAISATIVTGFDADFEIDVTYAQFGRIGINSNASLRIEPHAGNALSLCVLTNSVELFRGQRSQYPIIDQLIANYPRLTDAAIFLLDHFLPFAPQSYSPELKPSLGPAFMLLAIARGPQKLGRVTLEKLDVNLAEFSDKIGNHLRARIQHRPHVAEVDNSGAVIVMLEPLLDAAQRESRHLKHTWIGTEHLLLAAIEHADPELIVVLADHSLTHERAREKLKELLGHVNG